MTDEAAPLKRLFDAVEAGDADAEFSLGVLHRDGKGVEKDLPRAHELFQRATAKGHASAQVALGVLYATGDGVLSDPVEALRWYRMAADQGDATGRYNVGAKYDQGLGCAQDSAEAFRWYCLAAEHGLAPAQYNVANMLNTGKGVAEDVDAALAWFRRAADQGVAAAQYGLAQLHEEGRGTPRDPVQAVHWYELAAKQGLHQAQHNLGLKFYLGEGAPQDFDVAAGWFQEAARRGNQGSAQNLQVLVKKGQFVPYDDSTAEKVLRAVMAAHDNEFELWPMESVEWARAVLRKGRGHIPALDDTARAIGTVRASAIRTETLQWRSFDNALKGYRSGCHSCTATEDVKHFLFGLMRVADSEMKWSATAVSVLASAALLPLLGAGAVKLPGRNFKGAILAMKLALCPTCQKRESNWMGLFMLKEHHTSMHPLTEQLRVAGFTKFLENEQVPIELKVDTRL